MKISIITPNYNYGSYIGKTIESVISQNYSNIEHLIVDDGSTDNSIDIIGRYLKKYAGIIKLIQQKNAGQTRAINRALSLVTGDIIGWINSDDYYCENTFSLVIEAFRHNPEADAVFGNFNVVDIDGNFIYMKRHFKFNPVESVYVGFGNTLTSSCIFWKKSLSDRIGGFNELFNTNMDGEYFSRLTFKSNLHFIDMPFANFRRQKISMAGIKHINWSKIVKQEINHEKALSYNRLTISKYLPYSIGKQISLFYNAKRVIKRIIRADYYRIYIEKRNYKKLSKIDGY